MILFSSVLVLDQGFFLNFDGWAHGSNLGGTWVIMRGSYTGKAHRSEERASISSTGFDCSWLAWATLSFFFFSSGYDPPFYVRIRVPDNVVSRTQVVRNENGNFDDGRTYFLQGGKRRGRKKKK